MPFLTTKRRFYELLGLLVIDVILYLLLDWDFAILFGFGFIWNWVSAQDITPMLTDRRFKYSMLRLVSSFQALTQRFVSNAPKFVKIFMKCLPAGIFWSMVILFNESEMPWYMTFVGSFAFELLQIEIEFFHQREKTP